MGAAKTHITNLIEMRFDYQSARNILQNWRKLNGIKEEPEVYDDAHLASLLEYLKEEAKDAARVHAAIERLILDPNVASLAHVAAEVQIEAEAVLEAAIEAVQAEETFHHHEDHGHVSSEEGAGYGEAHHEETAEADADAESEDESAEEASESSEEGSASGDENRGGKKKKKRH